MYKISYLLYIVQYVIFSLKFWQCKFRAIKFLTVEKPNTINYTLRTTFSIDQLCNSCKGWISCSGKCIAKIYLTKCNNKTIEHVRYVVNYFWLTFAYKLEGCRKVQRVYSYSLIAERFQLHVIQSSDLKLRKNLILTVTIEFIKK